MKKFVWAAAAFAAALCFGCGKNQAETPTPQRSAGDALLGGDVRLGITTEPATLDPLSPSNTADGRSILFNVFEGLVKPGPDGSLQPAIAATWRIEDAGRTYTFALQEGIVFHDGSLLTPEDVVFSLTTAAAQGFNGFDRIEGVEIVAATTPPEIRITLKEPDVDFLPYLTIGIVPKNNPDREKNPVGTGPFSISRYDTQQSLVLVKNPRYRVPGLPYLDTVTYLFIADSDALLLALQGSAIDSASITGSLVDQLDPTRFDILPSPSNSVQLLALNNKVPPLDNKTVREAINYAVDVQQIIDAAFYGRGEPSGSPLIPGLSKYYEAGLKNPYPQDVAKAKALLAEAGQTGFPLVITVPSNYTMHVDTAQVLVNQLGAVGIQASIRLVDWGTWLSEVYRGRRYEATIISVDAPTISPRGFLDRYQSTAGSNFVNFSSPRYDAAYDAALREIDENNRVARYKEAQRIISEEAASVYIQDIWSFRVFPKGRFAGLLNYPLYVTDFSTVYRTQ